MALNVLSDISAALTEELGPSIVTQFNRHSVLLSLLNHVDGAGKTCAWDVQFSGASAETYTEGADASNYTQDIETMATLSWGQYRNNFGLSGLVQAAVGTSDSAPDELINLVATRVATGAEKLANKIDADCFGGSGTGGAFVGLSTALAASGSYANISKSTYTEWAGNVKANGGSQRELTKALLDELEATIFDACGMQPNVIVCSSAIARKYESLFDSITRAVIAGSDISVTANAGSIGAPINTLSGFTGLTYKTMPIFRSKNCTANTLYMLNTGHIDVVSLPFSKRFADGRVGKLQLTAGGVEKRPLGLNVAIHELSKTGDADKYMINCYPVLRVKRVNAHGVLGDLSET